MILPTPKLLILLAAPAAALLIFPSQALGAGVVAYDLLLALVVLLDLWLTPRWASVEVTRVGGPRLNLGRWNRVVLRVRNASHLPLRMTLMDDVPGEMERQGLAARMRILDRATAETEYRVRPTTRGLYRIGPLYARRRSALGLVLLQRRVAVPGEFKVYPDAGAVGRYDLAIRLNRMHDVGLMSIKERGQGRVFESLRDYTSGDDPTDIAWKATARRGRMTVRNHEAERSQQVIVMLDCGRIMTTQIDRLSRLDHAVNATVLLTHVAARQGDYIGMVAFSDRIESHSPPMRGPAAVGRMSDALYRLEPRLTESDYDAACRFLALRHRKRSLIVILTDVIDAGASRTLMSHLARFARRHVALCVLMRNLEVEEIAGARPATDEDCYSQAMAVEVLHRRGAALAGMKKSGVDVLEVDPRQLTPRLIDHYLQLKRRGRI